MGGMPERNTEMVDGQQQGQGGTPGQQQQQNQQQQGQQGGTPETFEVWLDTQDAKVKELYTKHTEGLRNTVKATRDERDNFASQLKGVAKDLEEGSKARKALDELTAKYEQSQRQAGFYEEAGKPEIGCTNPKAAFLVASADSLFDRKGNPDWAAIKAAAPELFGGQRPPPGNAGSGTQVPPTSRGMNEFIRRAAGRV